MFNIDFGEMLLLVINDGDDVILIELCFRGLGGGKGWFLLLFLVFIGLESFFFKGGLDVNFECVWMFLLKGDFLLDLDCWCMGRGGVDGFRFDLDCLGGGGIGGVCWLNIFVRGCVLLFGGGGLFGGLLNFGFVGNGGRGILILKCLFWFWLMEE